MKIKVFLLHTFLLCVSTALFSQKSIQGNVADVEIGEHVDLTKGHYPFGFVGIDNVGFIQTTMSKKSMGFTSIGFDLQKSTSTVLAKLKSKYSVYEELFVWNNKAYILVTDYDKKTTTERLIFLELEHSEGSFAFSEIEVLRVPHKVSGDLMSVGFYKYNTYNKFQLLYDKGSKYIGVLYTPVVKKKDPNGIINQVVAIFDKELNPVSTTDIKRVGNFSGYAFHEDNLYLFDHEKIDPRVSKGKFKSILHISKIEAKTGNLSTKSHSLEANGIDNVSVAVDSKGKAMLMGYYLKDRRLLAGYYSTSLNLQDLSLSPINLYPFAKELILENESQRTINKAEKGEKKGKEIAVPLLLPRYILNRSDKGYYLVGEQYHFYVTTSTDSKGNVTYTYHYIYSDEYISSVDSTGKELWVRKYSKSQHWINTYVNGGIFATTYNDNLYIVRLDLQENQGLMPNQAPKTLGNRLLASNSNACLSISKVDVMGNISTDFPVCLKEDNILFPPSSIDKIAENKLMVSAFRSTIIKKKNNKPAVIILK